MNKIILFACIVLYSVKTSSVSIKYPDFQTQQELSIKVSRIKDALKDRNGTGQTKLILAIKENKLNIALELLKNKESINAVDDNGMTVLTYALLNRTINIKFIDMLLKNKAKVYKHHIDLAIEKKLSKEILDMLRSHYKEPIKKRSFVFVVPSYNNAKYYKKNLDSIFNQSYKKFRVIYIDDCSSDNTANLVDQYVQNIGFKDKFALIRNSKRKRQLANRYEAIHKYCADNEIAIFLDGDDWLSHAYVLEAINELYQSDNVWFTHSAYKYFSNNNRRHGPFYSLTAISSNSFRKVGHPPALRTFYCWLFKKIKIEDLKFNGQFFTRATDSVETFPMLEMAGVRFASCFDNHLVYNDKNTLNHNTAYGSAKLPHTGNVINGVLNIDYWKIAKSMKPYSLLT